MHHNKAKELLLKYQSGNCTTEEKLIVENWLTFGEITPFNLTDEELTNNLSELDTRLGIKPNIKKHRFNYNFATAAVVLIVLGLGFYLYSSKLLSNKAKTEILANIQDVNPGGNIATLVLAGHKTFNLKTTIDQTLVTETGYNISNTKEGQLIYTPTSQTELHNDKSNLSINTVTTPRGGQYQILLPDGTKVWLNSSSSLKFPTLFTSNERNVELKGEAYFEVTKNPDKPFRVIVNSTEVKVLGTHFNIMAYEDESVIKSTLLEGVIQLKNGTTINTLKPGQQGIVNKNGFVKVVNANTEQSVAWKNGFFLFNRTNLTDIMKQLSRWYNIDVIYKGTIPMDQEFVGRIKRDAKLSKTLEILEFSGVNFKISGHQLIVTPK